MRKHLSHYLGHDEKARIEIIPMIDIMMFLLVFFMLVMLKMVAATGLKLHLPDSSTTTRLDSVEVNVAVSKDGALHFQDQTIAPEALSSQLAALEQQKKVTVTITGDEGTPYQAIVKAMDIARAVGITEVGLAAKAS
ncbi:ExbD/TolR family protein [Burkholderia sp. Ac-20379]|uniref:ExbD/TolR family protein n=1 Tax=Burkholderia sp. Ac-20379 TaxID=2703900 RepID=UPI001DACBDA4|nr:biopolymer transporter ExbD [Burkholderia sp. Ac-20379]MBN3723069.1 biopolymer transporter ExbD [Burkholderia sp. Ac-20379]